MEPAYGWQTGELASLPGSSLSLPFSQLAFSYDVSTPKGHGKRDSHLLIINLRGKILIGHNRKAVSVKNVHSLHFSLKS